MSVCVCTESPVLERLQRKEKVCVCVSEHCHSSLANRTCIRAHRGLVVGKLLTHEHAKTHRHTGARTHIVRSQLSTPASQLIKPNPRDWTEEFKWELPCPPPLKFCPFQLTVAGAALVASNRYNTPTFSVLSASSLSTPCCLYYTFGHHTGCLSWHWWPFLLGLWPWGV